MEHLLSQKKAAILDRWYHLIMETYPPDTSLALKRQKDRFANPVEYTISQETKVIYEGLLQNTITDRLSASLDNIIRIRAVQDFTPSQAIAFIFLLKKAIREVLADDLEKAGHYKELLDFETRIDKLALLALDMYTACREQVYEIQLNEVRTERERALLLLERASLRPKKPGTKPLPEDALDQPP